jgi:zinc transporter
MWLRKFDENGNDHRWIHVTRGVVSDRGQVGGVSEVDVTGLDAAEFAGAPVFALLLDGEGGGRRLQGDALRAWTPAQGPLWVQVDARSTEGKDWLLLESGIAPGDQETLLREVMQTRVELMPGGQILAGLRMFAPDTDEAREVRVLASAERFVAVARAMLPALELCFRLLARGEGPRSIAQIISLSVVSAKDLDQSVALELDQSVTELEYQSERDGAPLAPLRDCQHRAIALRRRLAAEREAIAALAEKGPSWIAGHDFDFWRNAVTSNAELIDVIDGAIDRIHVLRDDVNGRMSAVLNDRLYILTIVSTITLPLSFITGLLGVNVGGIPAHDAPWGFWLLCFLLVALAVGEYQLIRRLKWFPKQRH